MSGENDCLGGLQNPQQYLVEVFSVEYIVSGKGFIHENVVRPLAQSQNHLHLVLLAHRHGTQGTVSRQAEKVHEGFKPLIPPGGEVLPVEDPVLLGGESGEKGVLTGGKTETGNVVPANGCPIQGDGALIGQQAQNTLEQGGLSRSVFSQQPYDLTGGNGEVDLVQGVGSQMIGLTYTVQLQHDDNLLSSTGPPRGRRGENGPG